MVFTFFTIPYICSLVLQCKDLPAWPTRQHLWHWETQQHANQTTTSPKITTSTTTNKQTNTATIFKTNRKLMFLSSQSLTNVGVGFGFLKAKENTFSWLLSKAFKIKLQPFHSGRNRKNFLGFMFFSSFKIDSTPILIRGRFHNPFLRPKSLRPTFAPVKTFSKSWAQVQGANGQSITLATQMDDLRLAPNFY